jgi:hypothetical protein
MWTAEVPSAVKELRGAELGDKRLLKRLGRIAQALEFAPEESFPKRLEAAAELEGFYRFVNNERVEWAALLAAHVEATRERLSGARRVLLVQDSSDFVFSGDCARAGLGHLPRDKQGFKGHFCLALVPADVEDVWAPMGVLQFQPLIRPKRERPESDVQRHARPRGEKESARWEGFALASVALLPRGCEAVHVMDMEADDYELYAALELRQQRFVVRSSDERRLVVEEEGEPDRLFAALACVQKVMLRRVVQLGARPKKHSSQEKRRPSRKAREARLCVKATRLTLKRPLHVKGAPASLTLNFVYVYEPHPPPGEEAVEWRLVTSEPIDTPEDVARVVDTYRARWCIEEYFKALKTGCSVEKRQLESAHALLNALTLFIPVAWRMLLLRTLSRQATPVPATRVLTHAQLRLLKLLSKRVALPAHPTAREATLALAGMGGHLKHNGEPGWLTIGRGYEKLLMAELGWRAALGDL